MEGSTSNCCAVPGDPARPPDRYGTKVSCQRSPHALSPWWEHPLGGLASEQTQQGYLGSMVMLPAIAGL